MKYHALVPGTVIELLNPGIAFGLHPRRPVVGDVMIVIEVLRYDRVSVLWDNSLLMHFRTVMSQKENFRVI